MDVILKSLIDQKLLAFDKTESYIISPITITGNVGIGSPIFEYDIHNDFYFLLTQDCTLQENVDRIDLLGSDSFFKISNSNSFKVFQYTCFRDFINLRITRTDTSVDTNFCLEFLKVTPIYKQ